VAFWLVALLFSGAPRTAAAFGRIVNGVLSHDFPTTGALLYSGGPPISQNNAGSWCSGTLIGCQTFLTAAHCVEDDLNAGHYWVYLQHAGLFDVSSVTVHPSYTSAGFPEFDVAVLKLVDPVTGIDPTPINASSSPPLGSIGTIAGFGQTSGGGNDYGIKRAGMVLTSDCAGILPSLGNTELVCWTFLNPIGPPGDDSNTCNGDSGGPLFVDLGSGDVVAGITSGGTSSDCLPTDESYDANVFTYSGFILTELGADTTSACGGLGAVGDSGITVTGNSGSLGGLTVSASFEVTLPQNADEVRFTLNGEDDGSFDADFFVREGLGASPTSFDCKADGASNVGACSFASPTAGDWSVFVQRDRGNGQFQLTTTVFGGDPSVCSNGIKEPVEDCDGLDDEVCPGECTVGCGCPPSVCGDNLAEQTEQCDGTDDAACPGSCTASCTCPASCLTGDLLIDNMKVGQPSFVLRMELQNTLGDYDGLDPRDQFSLDVLQGPDAVAVSIPASDPGWLRSRPEKGRYVWKGQLNGITRVKALDKTATHGFWKLQVKGRDVPGAAGIDLLDPTLIEVLVLIDQVCTDLVF
jgi:hypothetical protein